MIGFPCNQFREEVCIDLFFALKNLTKQLLVSEWVIAHGFACADSGKLWMTKKRDKKSHCFTDDLFLMRLQKGLDPNNVASQSISCRKILMQCNHDLTNVLSFSFCAEKSFQFRRKLTLNESAQKVVLALVQSYISQVL